MLLHLGLNVITFRTLLHLGQLLHLGLQQALCLLLCGRHVWGVMTLSQRISHAENVLSVILYTIHCKPLQ